MKTYLFKLWLKLRFGKTQSNELDWVEHVPSEIEYYDSDSKVIGYRAYGAWDPQLPYRGEELDAYPFWAHDWERIGATVITALFLCAFASIAGFITGYYEFEFWSYPHLAYLASVYMSIVCYGDLRRVAG